MRWPTVEVLQKAIFYVDFNIFYVNLTFMKSKNGMSALARACGVSAMTVSRALRQDRLVSPETRRKILEAAARAGYQPGGRTGRPRADRSDGRRKIRILLNADSAAANLYHAYLLGAIERTLSAQKCDCLLRTCGGKYENFLWLCEGLRSEPDCPTMILGSFPLAKLRTLLRLAPGAVLVDFTENPLLNLPYSSIGFDNVEAARLAVRHLLETGRRRILLIKGHEDHVFSMDIEKGYLETLKHAGLAGDRRLVLSADFTAAGAYAQTLRTMDRGVKFDAVFTNDEMAVGVMRALAEKDKRIPADVALAGCDGLFYGKFISPALTTITLDHDELGRMAAEMVLKRWERKSSPVRVRLVPRLEIRESTIRGKKK